MLTTAKPLAGTLRGRFRVVEELARARGAVTARAVDETTGREVVVKRLSVRDARAARIEGVESLSGPDAEKAIELFRREADVLASLKGLPGVPLLVDAFEERDDGDVRLFTVHQWIPGRTLAQELAEGKRFGADEAIGIGRAVAAILAALHRREPPVVHRDVKPSNVLLVEGGGVALLDFGAVRDVALTPLDGSTVVGTYGYMPPEQYEGHALPASDVYALGVTLLEAVTGFAPTKMPRTAGRIDVGAAGCPQRLAPALACMTEPLIERRLTDGAGVETALGGASPVRTTELERALGNVAALLDGRVPPFHGRVRLLEPVDRPRMTALGDAALESARSLQGGPKTAVDLLAAAGWSIDSAIALSKLREEGMIEVVDEVPGMLPRDTRMFLVLAILFVVPGLLMGLFAPEAGDALYLVLVAVGGLLLLTAAVSALIDRFR